VLNGKLVRTRSIRLRRTRTGPVFGGRISIAMNRRSTNCDKTGNSIRPADGTVSLRKAGYGASDEYVDGCRFRSRSRSRYTDFLRPEDGLPIVNLQREGAR
jgi:hypothetical protein